MQTCNEFEGPLVAPGPTIPTYRPSSQPSKRTNYTMSTLAPKYQQYLSMADDVQTTNTFRAQPRNENVADVVRFLQTHTASQDTSQSTGAREMIKAGQRRLRLALRNKKTTELKTKADDASRELAALQQEGYFPRSQHRKTVHKKNHGSTASNPKSASNLSVKSNSRRDVETIGQPWLDNPLETRDAPGSKGSSQLSSLDLRDLASFVEATVNFSSDFDDSIPPPYQPSTGPHTMPTATQVPALEHVPRPYAPPVSITAAPASPSTDHGSRPSSNGLPTSLQINVPQPREPNDRYNSKDRPFEEPLSIEHTRASAAGLTPPGSSASSKNSSAPTTPVLKLFPDAMPPRISSRGALRIPTSHAPTPTRSLSPAPGSQKVTALATAFEANNRDSRNALSSLPRIQKDAINTRVQEQATAAKPERQSENTSKNLELEVTQARDDRRPPSLLQGAIDAFPIPAPAKPLPGVPQHISQIPGHDIRRSFIDRQSAQVESSRPGPGDQPLSNPPHINVSTPSSPGNSNSSSHGHAPPPSSLVSDARDLATTQDTSTDQPRRGSLGKGGRSREEKVRSLIMKDLAASRYGKGSKGTKKSQTTATRASEGQQVESSLAHRLDESRLGSHRLYQRKISPGPSSPPPMSPPPSHPPRHPPSARRYCTSPASSMATSVESYENFSRPGSNRNARVYRESTVRSPEPNRESAVLEIDFPSRAETPLPSSDDEGPTGESYWNPPQKPTGGRRREKPAPIVIEELDSRGRPLRKHRGSNDMGPPTPQGHRKRGAEKPAHTHLSPNNHQSYDSHGYHASETKANPSLEGRIEHLERQNKILQAALLAALDVGVKQDLSSLLGAHAASLSANTTPPLTGRSFSSTTNTSTSEAPSAVQDRSPRHGKVAYRPDSWNESPEPFRKGGYDSDDSTETREIEEMIDDFDLDWLSDHPSIME
ncbi:hypothetical protein BJX99DRAFT_236859 [Aspergillus californicus]